jgi:RHS repeat-associated protein
LVGTAATQVQFRYDPIGRRIAKITAAKTELYVYDGWNLVGTYTADFTTDSATMSTAYTWGLDLSGSLQGAGGVGGLLAIHEQAGNGSAKAGQVIYPAYDGNGNIVRLLNSGGGVVASYAYDGFGNRLNPAASDIDGSGYADEQEFGFSTKFRDAETGLIYYGYRYYDPVTGRWPSRDPMGESLKLPIYSFVGNSPLSYFDLEGLQSLPADSNVGESGMGRFFGDDDDPNAGSTVTLCDRADALRVKIERLAKNDLRLGFLKTQHCILEKLCQKACCPSAAEWLENVIKDFMDPLFDALEGNPNEGWRKTFEQVGVYEAGNAGIEKTLSSVLVSSEARFELDQAKRMNEVMSARDMAITHISQDLRNALIRNGVGDDGDWKCIGDVVSECEKNEFTPLERGVSRFAGLIDASFDVGKFRDDMRDLLKQDGGSQ